MAAVLNLSGAWGATADDWATFDLVLGLTEDILPVVSNPEAKISPRSKLSEPGKVPSVYDREGKVVGIGKWTTRTSTEADIDIWSRVEDYGICIQTRLVRALDVDITDPDLAGRVSGFIAGRLGMRLPCRTRGNASKFLLGFTLAGDYTKRIISTPHGNIEFLAGGQQFIAAGTHPSRARYLWVDGLPTEFPVLDAKTFEGLWIDIAKEFGGGEWSVVGVGRQGSGSGKPIQVDDLAEYLDENGWTMATGRNGERHIRCPFEANHSTGHAGNGSTTYFLPGGEYEQGHFRCLHASCNGRTRGDFIHGIGYLDNEFEDVPTVVAGDVGADGDPVGVTLPNFIRNRSGDILATLVNLDIALRSRAASGVEIAHDEFREELMIAERSGEWRPFRDADGVALRLRLESLGFKPIGRELARDAITLWSSENRMDSAQTWLGGLTWDGVQRVDDFMVSIMGAEDTEYTRAVGRYLWTGLAGRILRPGVKADMVPIFEGKQGARKSTAVALISPDPEFFAEINLLDRDDDLARKMRGRVVLEIGELNGLNRKDVEHIKSFIARTHDNWTPKYKEFNTTYARRGVMVGTTNSKEFLNDPTGARRWLPVEVGVTGSIDVSTLVRDRDQLWAEAAVMFKSAGVDWSAEKLAAEAHDRYRVVDTWEAIIDRWIHTEWIDGKLPKDRHHLRTEDVLRDALGFDSKGINLAASQRVGNVLRALGYRLSAVRENGKRFKAWVNFGDFSK